MEGSSYHIYHFILYVLKHIDQALDPRSEEPELASIGHHQQAYHIKHKPPVSHGEPADRVSKHLQCFDGCLGPVTHDPYMGLPLELSIDEEPQIMEILHWSNHIMCGVLPIRKDQVYGSQKWVMLIWLLEEQKLSLIWLDCQARPSQPFFADSVPGSEELSNISPLLCMMIFFHSYSAKSPHTTNFDTTGIRQAYI